jgi:nucleoside permease NupC
LVIAAVESLAKKQGFEQIKMKDRSGVLLHPADWTAGVDYDEAEAPQNDVFSLPLSGYHHQCLSTAL